MVVATDDPRIGDAVTSLGISGILTDAAHTSGTARAAAVLELPQYADVEALLNVQADQPFLSESAAKGALAMIEAGFPMGTAAGSLDPNYLNDRSKVKVWVDSAWRAQAFSRGPTPGDGVTGDVFHHVGVYAYTRDTLLKWKTLPPTEGEIAENLEQLRALDHGIPIGVSILDEAVRSGIDTPVDLDRAQTVSDRFQVIS